MRHTVTELCCESTYAVRHESQNRHDGEIDMCAKKSHSPRWLQNKIDYLEVGRSFSYVLRKSAKQVMNVR